MLVVIDPVSKPLNSNTSRTACSSLLHRRLGHLSPHYLNQMIKNHSLEDVKMEAEGGESCDVCSLGKNTKLPFNHTRPRASRFLENVHVDISGINRTKGIGNESYYILFCDDFSSY